MSRLDDIRARVEHRRAENAFLEHEELDPVEEDRADLLALVDEARALLDRDVWEPPTAKAWKERAIAWLIQTQGEEPDA